MQKKRKNFKLRLNQKGQGMIEYIILVALMAVGTIGMVRVLGEGVNVKFSSITAALQGESPVRRKVEIPQKWQERRDLKDFLNGTTSSKNKKDAL